MMVGASRRLAMLHPREMVLPAPLSERLQRMTEPGGGNTPHNHFNITAFDSKSFFDTTVQDQIGRLMGRRSANRAGR